MDVNGSIDVLKMDIDGWDCDILQKLLEVYLKNGQIEPVANDDMFWRV